MLGARDSAEEVAQEVYMAVWRNAGSYDASRGSPITWISLTARSRAIDRLRSERSYEGAVLRATRAAAEVAKQADAPARSTPAEDFEIAERQRLVRQAMTELAPDHRRLLELAFFGGLSHSEIARSTETPLGTVKSRIRSSLSKLEKTLTSTMDHETGATGLGSD